MLMISENMENIKNVREGFKPHENPKYDSLLGLRVLLSDNS